MVETIFWGVIGALLIATFLDIIIQLFKKDN